MAFGGKKGADLLPERGTGRRKNGYRAAEAALGATQIRKRSQDDKGRLHIPANLIGC
jgi:hypothetical protein